MTMGQIKVLGWQIGNDNMLLIAWMIPLYLEAVVTQLMCPALK